MDTSDLMSQLMKHPASQETMSTFNALYYPGLILGGAGGGLIGAPIGTKLGGGIPNWKLAYIGSGLVVVSLTMAVFADKKFEQAVREYNLSLNKKFKSSGNVSPFIFVYNSNSEVYRTKKDTILSGGFCLHLE